MVRITSLKVKAAHGYMDLNAKFNKQLTFLVGINGSGKTTALRLIEAMLTPSLQLLDKIPHKKAELRISDGRKIIIITSSVDDVTTSISVSSINDGVPLQYSREEIFLASVRQGSNSEMSQDLYNSLYAKFSQHPVMNFLRKILDTPIFLGLDRKNVALHFDDVDHRDGANNNTRRVMALAMRRRMSVSGELGSSLLDVQVLIQEIYRKSKEEQELFAKKLREQMFLHAFDIQPSAGFVRALNQGHSMPPFLASIIKKRNDVEKALEDSGLKKQEFSSVVGKFFTHIEDLIKKYNDVSKNEKVPSDVLVDLALNRPVVDRVQKLIATSDAYNTNVANLWKPITEFIQLVNRFLVDTNKKLEIDQVGILNVRLPDKSVRSLDVLSSGERQIVVILGHLAINRELNRSGIFVVDEPELSLHLKWQEIFVESLLAASPKNQFILATHAPAIVLDRTSECESLDSDDGVSVI